MFEFSNSITNRFSIQITGRSAPQVYPEHVGYYMLGTGGSQNEPREGSGDARGTRCRCFMDGMLGRQTDGETETEQAGLYLRKAC